MALKTKQDYDATTLVASALRSATGNADAVRLAGMVNAMVATLDVTVDESTAADKLDVYIQTKLDGTNWTDVIHFTQHDGDAGAARYIEKIAASPAFAGFEVGSALGEGAVRDLLGDDWRARWVVVDDSASAAYTFSVTICPM